MEVGTALHSTVVINESQIVDVLRRVDEPELRRDIVSLDMVREVRIESTRSGTGVVVVVAAKVDDDPIGDELADEIGAVVGAVPGVDGVRVTWPDGWGLVRASNTTPVLVLRVEGTSEAALERIRAECMAALVAVKPDARVEAAAH